MDISNALESINWWAVLVASVSAFLVGGIWYGPLFGNVWQKVNAFSDEYLKKRNIPIVFFVSFLMSFIAALNLGLFLGPKADLVFGLIAGFLAGIGWVATFLAILYLFERRPIGLFLINAGYCIVSITVMGAILGGWR